MSKAQLIEKESVGREYGFDGMHAIIDHPIHGRLWIMDGFGGVDTLKGGAVRWAHGMAVKLQPGDTLQSLKETPWNDYCALGDAVINAYDDTRPVLNWHGKVIQNLAAQTGL